MNRIFVSFRNWHNHPLSLTLPFNGQACGVRRGSQSKLRAEIGDNDSPARLLCSLRPMNSPTIVTRPPDNSEANAQSVGPSSSPLSVSHLQESISIDLTWGRPSRGDRELP